MGWKTFKEHFGITHIVRVAKGRVLIGTDYVSDLASIDVETGTVIINETFSGFLEERYPEVLAAKPAEILSLLEMEDTFTASIPVFTYERDKIVEKACEEPGWPNVTHDGLMMYENTFSTVKATAIRFARDSAEARIRSLSESIERTEQDLANQRASLAECKADLEALNLAYPIDPPAADDLSIGENGPGDIDRNSTT